VVKVFLRTSLFLFVFINFVADLVPSSQGVRNRFNIELLALAPVVNVEVRVFEVIAENAHLSLDFSVFG